MFDKRKPAQIPISWWGRRLWLLPDGGVGIVQIGSARAKWSLIHLVRAAGEHFPPNVVELDTNSSNSTNATNSSCSSWNWFCEDEDDYDQDRTQDPIWDQVPSYLVPFSAES